MNIEAGGLDAEDGCQDFQHRDRATELPLVPLQSMGTGNPRRFGFHNIKKKYRKCTEKPKEVFHLCTSLAAEHNTEKIMGSLKVAITKAGNLLSTQLLPDLTCMRKLVPSGAGDPTKLMTLAEKFWQALGSCPLASTCSTHGKRNEDPLAACGLCGDPTVGMTTGAENGEEHLSLLGTSA